MTNIPSQWQLKTLGEVAQINPPRSTGVSGLDPKTPVTFVPMSAVSETEGRIAAPQVRPFEEVARGYTCFTEGDVIFAKITPCMQNGKSAVATDLASGLGFGSTEFHVIRPSGNVLPEWIYHFVRQRSFREEARLHFRGTAGQQRVPAAFLADHSFPLPPLEEQKRIIAKIWECLSRVAEVGSLQEESLVAARALMASYLSEFESSVNWPLVPVASVILASNNGRSIRSDGDSGNGRVLTLSSVRDVFLNVNAAKTVSLDQRLASTYSIAQGDVFVSRSNTIDLVGLSAVATEDGELNTIFPDLLIRLKPDTSKALPLFLAQALRMPAARKQIRSLAKGTSQSMVKISGAELRGVVIPVPSISDQESFIAYVEELRTATQLMIEGFDPEERQKVTDAILKRAFGGEL